MNSKCHLLSRNAGMTFFLRNSGGLLPLSGNLCAPLIAAISRCWLRRLTEWLRALFRRNR